MRAYMILPLVLAACLSQNYSSNFNRTPWGKFEEPINACYTTNAGSVSVQNGTLKVVANQGGTPLSNHVIAQQKINSTGATGRFTYRINFYIEADPTNNLSFPQTGPEISVQNTRSSGGSFFTNTMALQYVANPWSPTKWNVWTEVAPGVAGWVSFPGPTLTPRVWYQLTLKADMVTNSYTSAVLCRGTSCQTLPIGGLDIASEAKWNESALWLTAEAENLWQDACGGSGALPLSATLYYDNVQFTVR